MGRIARRIAWFVACLIAVIALAAALRVPIAERLAARWLADNGVAPASFTISRLGFDGITVTDISAGTDGAITVERLAVAWSPATVLGGRADAVTLSGVRVRAAVDDAGGLHIAGVPLAPKGSGAPADTAVALPLDSLEIADARLDLATPYGAISATADARYRQATDGIEGGATIAARGQPGHVDLVVALHGRSIADLQGTVDMPDGAVDTPALRLSALTGSSSFGLADGRLDAASVEFEVPELTIPAVPGSLTGALTAEGTFTSGTAGVRLTFEETPGGRGLRGTAAFSDIVVDGDRVSTKVTIDTSLQRYDGFGISLRDLSAALPLAVEKHGDMVEVTLTEAGRLNAAKVSGGGVTARDPIAVSLPATGAPLATVMLGDENSIAAVSHALIGTVAPTRVGLADEAGPPTLTLGETRLNYAGRYDAPDGYAGKGNLANTSVRLDDPALSLQRVEADVAVADIAGNGTLRFDIGRLVDGAAPERFAAVGVAVNVTRKDGKARLVATVRDATQTVRATASGPWPLEGPRDEIFIDVPPIEFERGGKQPATLLPILGALDVAQGRVFGNARIARRNGGFVASADATVENMDLTVAGADIAGLAATVHFDSLAPPMTPPRQQIAIARIDMVTPIEDVRIDYRLTDAAGIPRLDIDKLTARLLGGSIALTDAQLSLDGKPVELPVVVRNLDVAELLALAGVDGLACSGALSGPIPLVLSPNSAEIRAGRLVADGPGVLRVDTKTAADFLAAQGPSVDLAIRALEDFHYTELAIDVSRRTGGDAALTMTLLGSNPAVLDGHPFRFNINLKSNVDELIAALLQGYRIATERVGGSR